MRDTYRVCVAVALALCVTSCGDDDGVEPEESAFASSWAHPRPHGALIRGIGGSDEFNQWAVGDGGLITQYRGLAWRNVASPTTKRLHDVVGFDFGAVVTIVGDDGIILRNLAAQFSGTNNDLYAVFGLAPNNLVAVGENGTILEYDGGGWQPVASPTASDLYDVWGLENGDMVAVGEGGVVIGSTGGPWFVIPSFTASDLNAVWADKPGDWFAVGDGGGIYQDRGAGWTPMPSPRADDFYDIFGSDSAYVWIVGDSDSILFYDQLSWQPIAPSPSGHLEAIWATICPLSLVARGDDADARRALHCSNTYFAGAGGIVTRFTLFTTYDNMTDAVTYADLRGIHGRATGDIYAVGDGGTVVRNNGSAWSLSATGVTENLHDVFVLSALDVFVVGDGGRVLRGADGAWNVMTSGTGASLRGVWAQSATQVFAAGDAGTLLRFDGVDWNPETAPLADYTDVWGVGNGDAFAAARGGAIAKRVGGAWSDAGSPVVTDLFGVWASSSTNVFAVGAGGVILHIGSDGIPRPMVSGVSDDVVAVAGAGAVWAVTSAGAALSYDGTTWHREPSQPVTGYGGVFVRSADRVLAGGDTGAIVEFRRP